MRITIMGILCTFILTNCADDPSSTSPSSGSDMKFTKLKSSQTNVDFSNEVVESNAFNFINYVYIYNGGGIATGDINNDGLVDIYFTSNQGSNKLYLNKGDMKFEDITESSGTGDTQGWSTGVSMVDVNLDGLLDIYVCKSASPENAALRQNKLYVNKGNNTFAEMATQYNLNDDGFSTQSYFLDYDRDGDLDMYLVNHRSDFENNNVMSAQIQSNIIRQFSDRLYRNDGVKFTDVTAQAGMANKNWGLSASVADYNNDGWLDIYVANDFTEPDQLWINNKKGGFTDQVLKHMDHISYYSMGSDVADFNNDGLQDLMVLDMVSEDHVRSKQNMAAMSSAQFNTMVDNNYHHQYMANMLQLNRGYGQFSEVAHIAGVSKTDWSWAPLFADFDNDGNKDLFVTNGIKRDMTDNDYKIKLNERSAQGMMNIEDVFELTPSTKLQNYAFRNKGDGLFEKASDSWGLTDLLNSNGASYADLDNDGDLDLVINNLDDQASIYRNDSKNNYLKIQFEGPPLNRFGIGADVEVMMGEQSQSYQHFLSRGFQSSVSPGIIIGLGDKQVAESVTIRWPDGASQQLTNVEANQTITVNHGQAKRGAQSKSRSKRILRKNNKPFVEFDHKENQFDDFAREILLPNKLSTQGPAVITADVNSDGLDDVFITGAKTKASALMVQQKNGTYRSQGQSIWIEDRMAEDVAAHFFDADGDNDLDLYVGSGGNEVVDGHQIYKDRLYVNSGNGSFRKSANRLPDINASTSVVVSGDFDSDGDQDLFVGGRSVPGRYPMPANSYILENQDNKFVDVTEDKAADLMELGLVTDASFSDYDADGDLDILIVGEWMPLTIFENESGQFTKKSMEDLTGKGWMYAIQTADLDGDGDEDVLIGNLGENNKFGAKEEKPFHVFCDDFDNTGNLDIVLSKESKGKLLPVRGRECSSEQMPFIKDKFPTFKSFAEADLISIYGDDQLSSALHYEVTNFKSLMLINDGKGSFSVKALPVQTQYGPVMDFEIIDVNGDGQEDIIGAGNIYNAEVETVRYDASKGFVLINKGKGDFTYIDSGFLTKGNVKDLAIINHPEGRQLLVAQNDGPLESWTFVK